MKKAISNISNKNWWGKLYKKIIEIIKENKWIIPMFISYYILDITTLVINNPINFFSFISLVPFLFSFIWICLFITICFCIRKKSAIIFYITTITIYTIMFIVHNVYYTFFNMFFDFSMLDYASAGGDYFVKAILDIKLWIVLVLIINIFIIYYTIKNMKHNGNRRNYKRLFKISILFIVLHAVIPLLLGRATTELEWDAWSNKRNIYNTFNDSNKSMVVTGFYEYNFRSLYVNYFKVKEQISEDDMALLEEKFMDSNKEYINEYTGVLDGKNLVIVQMEGVDDFLIKEDIMPYTYNIMKNSLNFTNHYSFTNGGGSTFNSEFMVNVGYSTPYTYNENAYAFSKNNFKYSLPNIFKGSGYSVNAFHFNTPEYYSRQVNYQNFGYENYYDLKTQSYYKNNKDYILDRELILNPTFDEKIFNKDQKFLSYVITYSVHMPFSSDAGVCELLLKKDKEALDLEKENKFIEAKSIIDKQHAEGLLTNEEYNVKLEEITKEKNVEEEIKKYSEYDCLYKQAKETDYMVKLLFEKLEKDNLLDNTAVVFFADHYLYTLEDKTILDELKESDSNLINKTPFFIWSKNIEPKEIKKLNSQLNILPTLLNMYGMDYRENYYLMQDIFDPKYEELVMFPDLTWYNGSTYVKDGEILFGKPLEFDKFELTNYNVNRLVRINDAVLKSDYFNILTK